MELFATILVLVLVYLLWKKTRDIKKCNDYKTIINVLDRLHDFAIRDLKNKDFDFDLYKVLNGEKVYQEVIHMGIYPILEEGKEVSPEFIDFINKLSMYMEYDVNYHFFWAKNYLYPSARNDVYKKICSTKREILHYLLDKKLISNEVYIEELDKKVKCLEN